MRTVKEAAAAIQALEDRLNASATYTKALEARVTDLEKRLNKSAKYSKALSTELKRHAVAIYKIRVKTNKESK